ncbi:GTPase IMAP family member 8-like [Sinocyclocheilus grahami]|uniref:GTPase IMAP family member 8-like n=1 Tax=Sinocyclocheilus grahami TaxID=75366 RepID=UPI0007AD007B|nr:PREDICTED: GTPase IMAP family member 8-like [Sinocyclocheilus grahami]
MEMMENIRLNLVLLGRSGVGKSSTGNTILGREAFTSLTEAVTVEVGDVCGLPVRVYDTPGFSNAEHGIYEEVLQKCESGLCAFLLVLRADRFNQEDQRIVEQIEELLGEKHKDNTWIIFTREDELEEGAISTVIDENEALKKLVQMYEPRFHVLNNKDRKRCGGQVKSLLSALVQGNIHTLPQKGPKRISTNIQEIPVSNRLSRRIVLLGKTGVGKSASGNTILRKKEFKSLNGTNSVTRKSSEKHATVSGRNVSVIDTPGFFDTQMAPEQFMIEIARSVYLSCPGPHAFLIVFPVNNRFTDQEVEIPQIIEMLFGEEVLKYSIILFTHEDQLQKMSVEKLINDNENLKNIVDQCGGRYHVFNNRDENNIEQVNDLLQKIDTMIKQNGGGYYSNEMFEDALRFRQKMEIDKTRKETEENIRTKIQRENNVRQQQEEKKRREEMEREREKREEKSRKIKAQRSEIERLRVELQKDKEERNQEEKKRQDESEQMRKETDEKSAKIEAQSSEIEGLRVEMQRNKEEKSAKIEAQSSEIEGLRVEMQRNKEERNQGEKLRQEELEGMKKEMEDKTRKIEALRSEIEKLSVEMQRENNEKQQEEHKNTPDSEETSGFKNFFSKYWKYFLKGIAVGAIIGGVAGEIVCGVVGRVVALIVDKKQGPH